MTCTSPAVTRARAAGNASRKANGLGDGGPHPKSNLLPTQLRGQRGTPSCEGQAGVSVNPGRVCGGQRPIHLGKVCGTTRNGWAELCDRGPRELGQGGEGKQLQGASGRRCQAVGLVLPLRGMRPSASLHQQTTAFLWSQARRTLRDTPRPPHGHHGGEEGLLCESSSGEVPPTAGVGASAEPGDSPQKPFGVKEGDKEATPRFSSTIPNPQGPEGQSPGNSFWPACIGPGLRGH